MTEQNLVAFQYKGNLYYRTSRDIKEGEELLVFYGNSFAKNLGIDTQKYFEPVFEDLSKTNVFCCRFCHVGLSTKDYKESHEKFCRFKPIYSKELYMGPGFTCQFCKCTCTSKEVLQRHEKYCSLRKKQMKNR